MSARDWRSMPSREEVLAHNARTGGGCFGPWLVRRGGEVRSVVWVGVYFEDDGFDVQDGNLRDVDPGTDPAAGPVEWSPIGRDGDTLPWPVVEVRP